MHSINYCVPDLYSVKTKLTQTSKISSLSTNTTTFSKQPLPTTKVLRKPISNKYIPNRQISNSRVIRPDPANVKKLLSRWEVKIKLFI